MCLNSKGKSAGFTLLEVMVALAIMAIIAVLSGQAFQTASSGAAATREAMDRFARIDRTFVLLENDFRNALPMLVRSESGNPLPPLYIAVSDDYWLTILRGGFDNTLFQPRTELVRIGYRYVNEAIWRDTWYNPADNDENEARKQKLLTGVRTMEVRVLPRNATSIAAGPWLDSWPGNPHSTDLPIAIEITLELDDLGEVTRLFTLLPGAAAQGRGGPPPNFGGNNGQNNQNADPNNPAGNGINNGGINSGGINNRGAGNNDMNQGGMNNNGGF